MLPHIIGTTLSYTNFNFPPNQDERGVEGLEVIVMRGLGVRDVCIVCGDGKKSRPHLAFPLKSKAGRFKLSVYPCGEECGKALRDKLLKVLADCPEKTLEGTARWIRGLRSLE